MLENAQYTDKSYNTSRVNINIKSCRLDGVLLNLLSEYKEKLKN